MKILVTFILQFGILVNITGQIDFDKYYFVKASKLILRSEPKIDSKALTVVNNGEKVKVINDDCPKEKWELIDGYYNCWAKVEANGLTGFMYKGYLDEENVLIIDKHISNKEFILFRQGFYGPLKIPYGLNWYEVVSKSDGEYLENVEIQYDYFVGGEPDGKIKLTTNLSDESSKLILASKRKLKTGLVGMKLPDLYNYQNFIDPTYKFWLPVYSKESGFDYSYFLLAHRNYEELGGNFKYQITMRSAKNDQSQILDDFDFNYNTEIYGSKPLIVWFGDIDNDKIPDWMIYKCGEKTCGYTLYLSSLARENEFVRRIEP